MRPFDMNARDHRGDVRMLRTSLMNRLQGGDKAGFRRSDDCGQESRDAHLEHRLAKGPYGRDVERESVEVMPSITVDLQINEARAQPLLLAVLLEFDGLNQLAFGGDHDAPARRGIAAKEALGRGERHSLAGEFRSGGRVDIQRAVGVLLNDRSGTGRRHRTFDRRLDRSGLTLVRH